MNRAIFDRVLSGPGGRGYPLDHEQTRAVDHTSGPLWLLAGPGSGKTEVLVTRTLRLICVDRVPPNAIFVATFTRKAARSMEDRLATYFAALQAADPTLCGIDLGDMCIGTLHQLCNDLMQEYRYRAFQNVRLMDDFEQHLFVYRHAAISNHTDNLFWTFFDYAIPQGTRWRAGGAHPPNKWARAKAAVLLFNRVVEDLVDTASLRAADPHWAALLDFYNDYIGALQREHRSDFAHLQQHFSAFLASHQGATLVYGGGGHRGLEHVLVDEYQDTNPIQEQIYLRLAARTPHNLVVVGDDDQALYRFRGGTVACMVNFDRACAAAFGVTTAAVPLTRNYRSHQAIVQFFDDYITSFPEMRLPGVRAPSKGSLTACSSISGAYPAVSWLATKKAGDVGDAVARLVTNHLLGDHVIADPSQCLLLMRSTRDSARNAGPFIAALRRVGLQVYNPRSKTFMDSDEVQCLFACLVHVLDPAHAYTALRDPELVGDIRGWVQVLDIQLRAMGTSAQPLVDYIAESVRQLDAACRANPNAFLDLTILEITYRLLSLEPFRGWRADPSRNFRLSKVTRLLDAYHANRQDLLRSSASGASLEPLFVQAFYYSLVGYLQTTGINDDEDDDIIVPRGHLPLMTIHQSKGLEFPYVIVVQLGSSSDVSAAQQLEVLLETHRRGLYPRAPRSPQQLAIEDDIRLFYVAYSRAQHGLILAGTPEQFRRHVAVPGRDWDAFRRGYSLLTV